MQRIIGFELLGETHLVRRIVGLDARVLRNMQIHMLGVHHQVVEHTLKLLHKHHGLHATQLGCLLLAQPVPEPDDLLRRRILDEQNLPIGRVGVPRRQGQVCILLVNTTKIQQIRILAERLGRVTATRILVVGNQHGNGVAFHLAHHILAVADVKL